jgi:hypothetical protein
MVKKPLGFGDTRQTAEFFGLRLAEVEKKCVSGEWPSYLIGGKRVFDLDAIVETLARPPTVPTPSESPQ